MSTTYTEIKLEPAYRQALRSVATWLERAGGDARRAAFAARSALANLTLVDGERLARWLAWQCLAAHSQGNVSLLSRIQRLDGELAARVKTQLMRLPLAAEVTLPMRRSA
ncbi:hypothetical protein [Oleiagrimonas sp. C23AA]|uniref:hypothetical protein n=1 Tax=Oleiagrimonas sp. C23AA TaxID=2719047 RepID=UPI00142303D4|nr:hypothetical protein [Oleiagrimonas sp. C23AA]NII12289.1 hypothetical protein [Oleiagrimonas sp. C23AA]